MYTVEYHLAIKREWVVPLAEMWMGRQKRNAFSVSQFQHFILFSFLGPQASHKMMLEPQGHKQLIHLHLPSAQGALLAHIEPLLRGKNLESSRSLSCWWGFPGAKHSQLSKTVSGAGLFLKIARETFLSSLETHYKVVMFFQMLPLNFLIIWLMFHILPALKDALRTHWLIGEGTSQMQK